MTPSDNPAAILFDIDGTLVDSNYLHVESWAKTFDDIGIEVDSWRIHHAIGMDSGKLLEEFVGSDSGPDAERAKEVHGEHYRELARRLRPFQGARELLTGLSLRGYRVVLATSAPADELENLLRALDVQEVLHAVTSAEDVDVAKPEPDIIHAALRAAGVAAERAILVGDTVWDIVAAARAGVSCIGVETGGIARADLIAAGAIAVYPDVAELLTSVEDAPLPGLA